MAEKKTVTKPRTKKPVPEKKPETAVTETGEKMPAEIRPKKVYREYDNSGNPIR